MAKKKDEQVDVINLSDRQTVYLTANASSVRNGSRAEGDEISVHPKQAEALIKSGKATEAKATTSKKGEPK